MHYQYHHHKNLRARLTSLREQSLLHKCLAAAGNPSSVLDLPCGTGRFWQACNKAGVAELIAGDNSAAMLEIARKNRLTPHFPAQLINTSAFHIDLPDNAVDLVACMRFYHHFSHGEDRDRLLDELKRVSRQFIVLSLWVDGNLAAARRLRRKPAEIKHGYGGRICRRREEVETEFVDAGLTILRHYDVWPRIQMWRTYLLEKRGETGSGNWGQSKVPE